MTTSKNNLKNIETEDLIGTVVQQIVDNKQIKFLIESFEGIMHDNRYFMVRNVDTNETQISSEIILYPLAKI